MRRGIAAGLCVVLVVLGIGPIPLITSLWTGPWMLVAGLRVGDLVFAVAGVILLLIALLGVAALACAVGIARGQRRPAIAGAVLGVLIALAGLAPAASTSPLLLVPGGRIALMALAACGLVMCAWCARTGGREPGRSPVVRIAWVAVACVVVTAGVLGVVRAGIPDGPIGALLPSGAVVRATGPALDVSPVPRNPFLANAEGSTIHNDAWMTDTYTQRRIADPAQAQVVSLFAGGDCASILFDGVGHLVATCVSATRVVAHVIDERTLTPLASRELFTRPLTASVLTDFSGGGYSVLDSDRRLVVPQPGGVIARYATSVGGAPGIRLVDTFDVSSSLAPGEQITSVVPDWTGPLWFVGRTGTVGLLDPGTGRSASLRLDGRDIENSFAVAEGGGAYVVTSAELAFLQVGDGMMPLVSWSVPYDAGSRRKPGQTSRASGTTPTIMMGGRFVAIADNAEPRMHVEVYDAEPGARDRLVCRVPVFADGRSATENSLVAAGSSLFVENNYGYALLDTVGGRSTEPGVARIDVDAQSRTCRLAWENRAVRVPSLVSKVSSADGLFLTYSKERSLLGIDAWSFTGIDATTGEVAWTRLAGTGPFLNNHYAALYVGPSGGIYVGTISGIVALLPAGQ